MRETTLGYISRGDEYLLLYRNKKKNDLNEGKWVGIGGGFEDGETAEECFVRETMEETGLTLNTFEKIALIHFRSDQWEDEEMHLFIAELSCDAEPDYEHCSEGELKWVKKDRILSLPMWAGDKYFLEKMAAGEKNFEMTLRYVGEKLVEVF